jgi:hypothetical protein
MSIAIVSKSAAALTSSGVSSMRRLPVAFQKAGVRAIQAV